MIISIIAGSHRSGSQSRKVAEYLGSRLKALGISEKPFVLDLSDDQVGFWKEDLEPSDSWKASAQKISESDGYVFVVPEWDGMAPAAVKNFFHMFTKGEIAHKPGLIVSVSAGINGAYPISELRMSSYKNTRICYIPDNLIIRNVHAVLNDEPASEGPREQGLRERIDATLGVLGGYARVLHQFRKESTFDLSRFKDGM